MDSKTNNIRPDRAERVKLDKIDRKLLRLLAKDSDKTYSELSELVFLSPPAVHERVQKLRRNGVIKGTHAVLDGPSLGCSLLSFLHVEAEGSVRMDMLNEFYSIADVEEIHSVAGETNIIFKVRTRDSIDLEKLIEKVQLVDGVKKVKCFVVLSSKLERGPQPEMDDLS
ncbi:Lrp/AsnC family transcriptional regulator [Marinomonas primoryensis]|jgi:DNA-binding Lrp family transcriptional regulator|uniref:Lrp/AsnC family transcriptional regulator n=1 Tax=Marinomonas primoryensis TaxID=178399 RepID=A0A859CRS3_9GAMM|nr:Lrp/AsnC family transcriptional regulator [Marinomonas primoryensis]QKK78813.1 Lrp/AsnC family transcriptional regulator [Marinomonas primoryensis]|tara:strand:+ start:1908 stop:2414 length:507 start_codon:yes stop_codon:yes gene_type:complete